MKIKSCTLFILAFTVVLLSCSFAVAGDTDKQDAQKKKIEEFDKKIDGFLKKLPTAAKVAVLEIKMKAPELETPKSDPAEEDSRKETIKGLESAGEKIKDALQEQILKSDIVVVDRDAFKDIEKEIVYSQTGEVDPSSSAKFGKAAGATHLLIGKITYDGFTIGHPTATVSIKITEIESSKLIGTANVTLDIDQPKESTTSQNIQKQTLVDESFNVGPETDKVYSWNFPVAGSLDISLAANSDVLLYVVDDENYAALEAGSGFSGFARKERITSANFSVSIPKGLHYIVVSNKHSIFTSAGIVLLVLYAPEQ